MKVLLRIVIFTAACSSSLASSAPYETYRLSTVGVSGRTVINNVGEFAFKADAPYNYPFYYDHFVRMGPGWVKQTLDGPASDVVAPTKLLDSGALLGETYYGSGYDKPGIWDPYGLLTVITTPANNGAALNGRDMNGAGTVVGSVFLTNTGSSSYSLPVFWKNTQYTVLDTAGINKGSASAINTVGQIVGNVDLAGGSKAVIWNEGQMSYLPSTASSTYAYAINDQGWIAGGQLALDGYHVALWRDGLVTDLGVGSVRDMNESGMIIGVRYTASAGERGMLWHDGEAIDLTTLLDPARFAGWVVRDVYDINDLGQITASIYNRSLYRYETVMLSPFAIPEPAQFALLLAGLPVLLFRKRCSENRT